MAKEKGLPQVSLSLSLSLSLVVTEYTSVLNITFILEASNLQKELDSKYCLQTCENEA